MEKSTVVTSVAHYVPERIVSNDELSTLMDTSDAWIRERTGISERRFAEAGTPSSELGFRAAVEALKRAGNKEIDLLIAATLSPDYYFPGIATVLQHRLELGTIAAIDIRQQCSGLVYGVSCADAYLRSGQAKRVLIVCSEVQSPVLDMSDRGRDMAVLFGDGAGALVLEAEDCPQRPDANNDVRGVIDSILGSDGGGAEHLCMKTPGSAVPGFVRQCDFDEAKIHPIMDGRHVFKNAVQRMCEAASELLKRNCLNPADIDLLLPHQANMRINESVRNHLGLDESQVFNTISKFGNTTAATIPIGMSLAQEAGKLKKGDLLLTLAFGAGFTWGANLIRW